MSDKVQVQVHFANDQGEVVSHTMTLAGAPRVGEVIEIDDIWVEVRRVVWSAEWWKHDVLIYGITVVKKELTGGSQ